MNRVVEYEVREYVETKQGVEAAIMVFRLSEVEAIVGF